jgi:MFS family permease
VRWLDRVGRLRPDVSPVRESRDFRLLWSGGAAFYLGGFAAYVAMPVQVYQLTGSNLAVAGLGLAELLPLVLAGLYGGALADRIDRQRLLVAAGAAQILLTCLLTVNAFLAEPRVWAVYLLGALLTGAQSLQRPAREALEPETVREEQIPAASALSAFMTQLGMLIGPALGGLIIAYAGVGWCFLVNLVALVVATRLFASMGSHPTPDRSPPPSLADIRDGFVYASRRPELLGTYVLDLIAMVMALSTVLFPAIALDLFDRPSLVGLLYSAGAVGSLLAMATSGWTSDVHRHGQAIVYAAAAWGGAVALAGLMPNIWLMILCFTLAGGADMVSAIFRTTMWNQAVPDHIRGRLMGVETITSSVGPVGGQVRAGVTADLWTVRGAICSGGLMCLVGVAAAGWWLPSFWEYDDRTNAYARRHRSGRADSTPF